MAALLLFTVLLPQQAHASELVTAATSHNTIVNITANQKAAYKRALTACMDYEHQPNPIEVDVSDLGLTSKQAIEVGYLLHGNGELFWINTYNDESYGTKRFSLPCYYDDSKITKMRNKLDKAVTKALKRVSPGMSAATKVHMLHDYLLKKISYGAGNKDAYTGLVKGLGDCFGYSLSLDLLLRRAGFNTDMAFNDTLDHAWNIVKIGSKWFHVDLTWDSNYNGKKYSAVFDWKKNPCHLYLLQSDESMNEKPTDPYTGIYIMKSHTGWTCHHACTSTKYDFSRDLSKGFNKHCNDYKKIVRTFTKAGLKYSVTGVGKVALSAVTGKRQRQSNALTLPDTVTYKGVSYYVSAMEKECLEKSKATKLCIQTSHLSKARVKGSLTNSHVTNVKLQKSAKKKRAAYKKAFKASNCGKAVRVS